MTETLRLTYYEVYSILNLKKSPNKFYKVFKGSDLVPLIKD